MIFSSNEYAFPGTWNIGRRTLDLTKRPCLMGILNVTPDSFSDGSYFLDPDRAVERALDMEAQGADIIDIGGESTRPYATPVTEEDELERVLPVLRKLAGRLRIPISIDTYKAAVAREALLSGAEIVNDISGMVFDSAMADVVSSLNSGVIVTHTRGRPAEMQNDTGYHSLVEEILTALRESLSLGESRGIKADRMVIDPGIGFGKSCGGNLLILNRLRDFTTLGRPVMVGTSRKSFIGSVLNRPVEDRIFGTAATTALAIANGAAIVRVHDVREMRDVADMTMAVLQTAPCNT
ncbi:MAG: Dihydropteroate synthase [Geobacteraceae bacterium]|nr:Dihydropteroate synthase [Geobacteraceae bacterium]